MMGSKKPPVLGCFGRQVLLGSMFGAPALLYPCHDPAGMSFFSWDLPRLWGPVSDRKKASILDLGFQSLGTGLKVLFWTENYALAAVPQAGDSVHLNSSFFSFQPTMFWQRAWLLPTMPAFSEEMPLCSERDWPMQIPQHITSNGNFGLPGCKNSSSHHTWTSLIFFCSWASITCPSSILEFS